MNSESEPDDDFLDPVMMTLMTDPVLISSGYIFDRQTLSKFKSNVCPFTNKPIHSQVYPATFLKNRIETWQQTLLPLES